MTEGIEAASEVMRAGSKSFAAAVRLFAPRMRESAVLLYAWCRHCDDVVDGQELGFAGRTADATPPGERLAALEAETRRALHGDRAVGPAFRGLQEVVLRHAIPERYPLQHLDGFRMDVDGRSYATLADTLDYGYHVAGVVGVMMAHVMGARDPAILDRASDLGVAFQLTNIARDVVDDAGTGRVYLPADWLAEAGLSGPVSAVAVADPVNRRAVAVAARRLVEAAEPYYASATIGLSGLPLRAAWAIAAAQGIYREIGQEVVRRGEGAWTTRVSTSTGSKLRHVATGGVSALASRQPAPKTARDRTLYARPA